MKITFLIKDFISLFNFIIEPYKLFKLINNVKSKLMFNKSEIVKQTRNNFFLSLFLFTVASLIQHQLHEVNTQRCTIESDAGVCVSFFFCLFTVYWLNLASIVLAHGNRTYEIKVKPKIKIGDNNLSVFVHFTYFRFWLNRNARIVCPRKWTATT